MAKSYKTSADDPDPRLRTRRYARNFDVVYQQLLLMVRRPMSGWGLDERQTAQGIVRANYRRTFKQARVTAWVRKMDDGGCEVDVESADAPTGSGGNHKARVRRFVAELDDGLLGDDPFRPKYT